jgi:hypothetical protein
MTVVLSDLNFSYLQPRGGTEIAFLIEGAILLAAAFGAERLRGRLRPARTMLAA